MVKKGVMVVLRGRVIPVPYFPPLLVRPLFYIFWEDIEWLLRGKGKGGYIIPTDNNTRAGCAARAQQTQRATRLLNKTKHGDQFRVYLVSQPKCRWAMDGWMDARTDGRTGYAFTSCGKYARFLAH
ncbi:hypothetical protein B0T21DRAFT_364278 [Apiosordaria backusii]|uniref:Uncharacterized protein n=1 Tax=Apiosordaria backusii TaxID=314023 RepID=A0AA40BMM6_9PEZI|nr:hypothetical protein B0T21DRAFT_364278 [Apiosordaria backusii]